MSTLARIRGGATAASAPAPGRSLRSPRPRLTDVAFWLLPAVAFFAFPGYLGLGAQVMTTAVAVIGLDLVLGYAGIVSLGHAAFFGLGAYTAGLLAVAGWREPLTGLLAGGAVALAVGFIASFLVVRGKDLARLMVTLGVGLMIYEAANQASGLTGGTDGLSGIEIDPLLGLFAFDFYGVTAYWYAYGVLLATFVAVRLIVHSPLGLSLKGVREGVRRMPALGVDVDGRLRVAFALSAGIAGLAGALMAETTQFVGVDALSVPRAAEFLVMLVLGGTGRLYGAVVGTAVFMIAHDILSDLNPVYWEFWMGILLMAVVVFARGGLVGLPAMVAAVLRRRIGR